MMYALDTNIISYVLKNNAYVKYKINAAVIEGNSIIIPPMVYYEIFRGLRYHGAETQIARFEEMLDTFPVGEMTKSMWEKSADIYAHLRRSGRATGETDILIAAYCIIRRYTLVTNNIRHFADISDLTVVNWSE